MKKRLLVLSVMVGLIATVSFSVFAASDSVSILYHYGFGGEAYLDGSGTHRVINFELHFKNDSDKWAVSSANVLVIQFSLGSLGTTSSINSMYVKDFNKCAVVLDTSRYLTISPRFSVTPDIGFILAPHEFKILSFTLEYDVLGSFSPDLKVSFPSGKPAFTFKTIEELAEYPRSELSLLDRIRSLLEGDSNVSSDLENKSNSVNTQESIIHQQEQQWFQQNQEAINSVGLDNFNFGSGSLSGFAIMQQQFSNVWSALGDLNLIFTFTLLVSLATFILRHVPRTKVTEEDK